ncbi:hypothetical protein MKX01_040032 [Papaver californicum]|nr:hypothetical protein MKX01_040032 [Papaver californicum]
MEPFRCLKSLEWKRSGEPFNIRSELLVSFGNFREDMGSGEVGAVPKPTFIVRIGTILFHGKNFSGGVTSRAASESYFDHVGGSFWTNLPDSYMEAILATVIPKIRVDSHHTKEYYHVKVFDNCNLESSISIKCRFIFGHLKIHKIELNQKSATLDSNVKGGPRWAMGKKYSSDGRYTVVGVWHTNVQAFESSQLKVRLLISGIP